MISIYEYECELAGIDPKKLARLAARLERAAREMHELGVTVFGGSGSGSLRFDDHEGRPLILADIQYGSFDGGDGACKEDENGVMRGE